MAKKTILPKVVTGTHLTVTTHPDGRTEMKWDDEVLLQEVRAAIASLAKPSVKAKSINAKKPRSNKPKII